MTKLKPSESAEILDGKVIALLSYVSIFCIVPLIFKKENKFVLAHGKQGLVLFVFEVALFVFHVILGHKITSLATFILGIMSLIGIVSVLQGRLIQLWFVSKVADKITL